MLVLIRLENCNITSLQLHIAVKLSLAYKQWSLYIMDTLVVKESFICGGLYRLKSWLLKSGYMHCQKMIMCKTNFSQMLSGILLFSVAIILSF